MAAGGSPSMDPVSLSIHRMTERKFLYHADHRRTQRCSVRVIFTKNVADDAGGFL